MGVKSYRFSGSFFHFFFLFILIVLISSLSACGKEEVLPFSVSENAIRYTYPKKNLLALKSITIDKTEEENIYIFEFDKSSKYITKESIESILKIMKETPNNYRGNIIAESDEEIIQKEIKSYNTTKTTILVLEFEPDVECNHINIWRGNRKFDIQIEQNGVKINVLEFYSTFNEKEGTMYYSQFYDSKEEKWGDIEKDFLEDLGETIN